jgi:hypothetical protein
MKKNYLKQHLLQIPFKVDKNIIKESEIILQTINRNQDIFNEHYLHSQTFTEVSTEPVAMTRYLGLEAIVLTKCE